MKKFLLMLFVAFTLSETQAAEIKSSDEEQLAALVDRFSVAIVKKDKAWLLNNLPEACKMYEPSGSTLDKQAIVYAFTEGVYTVSKSTAQNKTFKVVGEAADGTADFEIEGMGLINGSSRDISGSYPFNLKFQKLGDSWKISEIIVNEG